jgi:hypothetical protein
MVNFLTETITAFVLLISSGDVSAAAGKLAETKAIFERIGFETDVIAGGNLSISGSKAIFEKTFDIKLEVDGLAKAKSGMKKSSVIPLAGLPSSLKGSVRAIEFQKGLDFGPKNF